MADNAPLPLATGSIRNAATDQVTYSGDTADVQLVRLVDVTGAEGSKLPVSPYALVSTANSSVANIAASGSFIGAAEDVSEYSHITVAIFTSHVSATDGLKLQQSSDGLNWDFGDSFAVPATTGKAFSAPVQAKFFRINYTNGATLTTSFRLQVIFSKNVKKGSSIRMADARSVENDFEEVAAYMAGFNGTSWDPLRATIANGMAVDVTRQPALTKGTQGTTGVSTQDLKDAGRVMWSAASAIAGVTAVTAEALVTMIVQRDGTAIATATSHTVTAGKRMRITSMTAGIISTGASVLSGRVSLRIGAAGAATATSPIVVTLAIPSGAALAQAGGEVNQSFPDGIEFSGAMQLGMSQVCSAATGTIWVNLTGFEY